MFYGAKLAKILIWQGLNTTVTDFCLCYSCMYDPLQVNFLVSTSMYHSWHSLDFLSRYVVDTESVILCLKASKKNRHLKFYSKLVGCNYSLNFLSSTEHSSNENTYLEVYDDRKDEHGGQQVHEVGQVLSVEGLAEGADLVGPSGEQVEEGYHGAFEFCAATCEDEDTVDDEAVNR